MKYRIILGLVVIGIIGLGLFAAESSLSKAEKDLKNGIHTGNIDKIKQAVKLIAQTNNVKALKILTKTLQSLSPEKYETYWSVLKGLDSFADPEAVEELAHFILKNKKSPLGRDALFILKSNTSPNLVKLLAGVLKNGTDEMRPLALDHLAEIRHKDSVETIITFLGNLKSKNSALKEKATNTLKGLTGQNFGDDIEGWTLWWNENKNKSDVIPDESSSGLNTGTAVDHLGYARLGDYGHLKRLPKGKIIVVTGECWGCINLKKLKDTRHDFDRIEVILQQMDIPHTTVPKYEFDKDTYKLDDKLVIIFNCNLWREHCVNPECPGGKGPTNMRMKKCGCPPPGYSNRLSAKTIKRVADFVAKGGYIFTEDWELEEVLEGPYKDKIGHTKYFQEDRDVKILPAPGVSNHPYLKGVFERTVTEADDSGDTTQSLKRELKIGSGKWKIDAESPDIKIKNSREVTVLIVSPDLKKNAKDSGAVAVTFAYGKGGKKMEITGSGKSRQPGGRVLHVLSHFGKQTQQDDEFVLQNLILNFIIEAMKRAPAEKKK